MFSTSSNTMKEALLVLYFFSLQIIPHVAAADATDYSRLRATILNGYDKSSRPVQNHKVTTEVTMHFYYFGFEFDETTSGLTLHGSVFLIWEDQHMKWDPLNYGNLTEITFNSIEIWKPDLMVYNDVRSSEFDHFSNSLIHGYYNSLVMWDPLARLTVSCDVDYYRWPYDTQTCNYQIASWAYDGSEILLRAAENYTKLQLGYFDVYSIETENREWELVSGIIRNRNYSLEGVPNYTIYDITIRVEIKRKSATHIVGVAVVAIAIAAAILMSYWLNPLAKERIPVILVTVFANTVYLNFVYAKIPQNGSTVPWAVAYFRDSLIMVLTALAWTCFLRYIVNTRRDATVPLPTWIDSKLDGCLGTIFCLNPRATGRNIDYTPKNQVLNDLDNLMAQDVLHKTDWGWFANILDRIAFFFHLVVYLYFIVTF